MRALKKLAAVIAALTTLAWQPAWAAPAGSGPAPNGNGQPVTLNGASTTIDAALANGQAGQRYYRLPQWRNALANMRRGLSDAYLMFLGDSTTRGTGSVGTTYATWAHNGYPAQLATQLAAAGLPVVDQSVCGAGTYGTSADPRLTFTGGFGALGPGSLGGGLFTSSATGTLSFATTAAVDTFDVYYVDNGSFSLNIDGGTAQSVTGTGTITPRKVTITAGASATHTLNTVWVSGAIYIDAIIGRNSAQKAIITINCAVHGATSSVNASTATAYSPAGLIALIQPKLAIHSIGINDMNTSVATSTTQSNIQAIFNTVSTYGDNIFVTPPPLSGGPFNTVRPAFDAMLVSLAAANPTIPFLDLNQRWNKNWATTNSLGWEYDALHPTQYGYSDWAAFVEPLVANP